MTHDDVAAIEFMKRFCSPAEVAARAEARQIALVPTRFGDWTYDPARRALTHPLVTEAGEYVVHLEEIHDRNDLRERVGRAERAPLPTHAAAWLCIAVTHLAPPEFEDAELQPYAMREHLDQDIRPRLVPGLRFDAEAFERVVEAVRRVRAADEDLETT